MVLKTKEKIFKTQHPLLFINNIRKEHQAGFLAENKLFKLYLSAFELNKDAATIRLSAYEALFFSEVQNLYGDDKLFLFYVGLNFCIRKFNIGELNAHDCLRWYKAALLANILIKNNTITNHQFSNIITFSCIAKDFTWVENFMETHQQYLDEEIRESELLYSRALISFYKKDFTQVLVHLSSYGFNSRYVLKSRSLIIRAHFEIFTEDYSYYSILYNNLNAFEHYLYRDKSKTQQAKLGYLNLCKTLKKITHKMYNHQDPKEILIWFDEKTERKKFSSKDWLRNILVSMI